MLKRAATKTINFVDDYCANYKDLFPEVRTFENFKYLHLGMISEIKRKSLPAITKAVGLHDAQPLQNFLTDAPWSVTELNLRRLELTKKMFLGYAFKQGKNELGWADYRLTSYQQIEKWWSIVMSAYLLVSLQAQKREKASSTGGGASPAPLKK